MNDMTHSSGRLVVVSNRLPVIVKLVDGHWTFTPGSGGLVSALAPVLRNRGGIWIGWPGTTEADPATLSRLLQEATRHSGYTLKPVMLDQRDKEDFYYGFANEVIWPLFHDLQSHCNFAPRYWEAYTRINRRFADVIMQTTRPGDFIWIHDYHLMNVGQELRAQGASARTGFFLHIPFPPLDIYMKLPWRFPLLRALLDYDLIGFQTLRDRRNFLQCVRLVAPDMSVTGKGQVVTLRAGNRELRVGTFPIGIDYQEFARESKAEPVIRKARELHEDLPGRQVILGVDRLDYTKGICHRFEAFRNALQRFPELHHRTTLIQVVVPSREDIPKYNALKMEMERLVGEINGQFTQSGWVPIHYIFRSLSRLELLAYYRACEIALITPLKDGMNLVAKEFCAATPANNGVLILSEFAGAAAQLQKGALLVNPYNVEEVAEAIQRAIVMGPGERRARMHKLKRFVRQYDIFWWVDAFLRAAIAKDLSNFPVPEEYVPHMETISL
ncbi:MAG: alpha,alpha-trehalose-phosphate synthase (UDP-forming) [Acidiferrobacter sp.]